MLFNLLVPLAEDYFAFNIFRYLTFRGGGALMTALIISFVLGPYVIAWLKRRQKEGGSGRSHRATAPLPDALSGSRAARAGAVGSGTYDGVDFIDEQDLIGLGCDRLNDSFEPLLEFATILGTSDQSTKIQTEDLCIP